MPYVCPVCGYPNLKEEPRNEATGGSYEICPSCGIEFGYDDEAGGDATRRRDLYLRWRNDWIAAGMPWRSRGVEQPLDWNPALQVNKP